MEMEMEKEGEGSSSAWSCATNWTVAEGSSLEGCISFDTSDEDAPALTSDGSLLLRPASPDAPPCEVTLFFRGKYEIHRVYAKTTARIFEIYYTKDADINSTKEYLCTVKCGPAMSDEDLHGSSQNGSAHSSEAESWVDVKAPGCPLKETQMHFEATAEISDVEPCASLTLRFLSLQTKSSVHMEEVYIFADPVDESSTTLDSSSGTTVNSNTSSLFAMLVPNLLQISKSGLSSRINERYFSADRVHNTLDVKDQDAKLDTSVTEPRKEVGNHTEKKDNTQTQNKGSSHKVEIPVATDTTVPPIVQSHYSTSPNQNIATKDSEVDTREVDQEAATNTCRVRVSPIANADQSIINDSAYRVEKILEKLVSKVEKIETYFTKFEEKIVGPISCIELRLDRLENQFNLFTKDLQSLRAPLRESCSHATGEVENSKKPASPEDSVSNGASGCQVETKASPGTTFKAPECLSEDESDDYDDHDDNDDTIHDDMEVKNRVTNTRKPISIDGALASALAAFATESIPNVNNGGIDNMDNLNLVEDTKQINFAHAGSFPGGEGVPLVSIDEVHIEDAFDLLASSEVGPDTSRNYNEVVNETTTFDENLHQVGASGINSEVEPSEETYQGSDIHTQFNAIPDASRNLNENCHQVNDEDTTSEGGPSIDRNIEDSDIHSRDNAIRELFSKSVIGEVSDEEEVEPGFAPDSPPFMCNSPLSSSDFEPSNPNYGEIFKGWEDGGSSSSTDSSFDGSFLKTKKHIELSEDTYTASSYLHDGPQKAWDEQKMQDPLAVLLDDLMASDMHGSVPTSVEENTTCVNDPFVDLQGLPESSEMGPTDSSMPEFESLI